MRLPSQLRLRIIPWPSRAPRHNVRCVNIGDPSTAYDLISVVFPSTLIQEACNSVGHWPCRPEGDAEVIIVEGRILPSGETARQLVVCLESGFGILISRGPSHWRPHLPPYCRNLVILEYQESTNDRVHTYDCTLSNCYDDGNWSS